MYGMQQPTERHEQVPGTWGSAAQGWQYCSPQRLPAGAVEIQGRAACKGFLQVQESGVKALCVETMFLRLQGQCSTAAAENSRTGFKRVASGWGCCCAGRLSAGAAKSVRKSVRLSTWAGLLLAQTQMWVTDANAGAAPALTGILQVPLPFDLLLLAQRHAGKRHTRFEHQQPLATPRLLQALLPCDI